MDTKGTNGVNPDGTQSSSEGRKVYPLTGDIIKRGEDIINKRLMESAGLGDLYRRLQAAKESDPE